MDKFNIDKHIGLQQNVSIRILDSQTHNIISQHIGHNSATNSMLFGIGKYLTGDGVLNQAYNALYQYIPKYISLGTMGLYNQDSDEHGNPLGIGTSDLSFVEYVEDEDYQVRIVEDSSSGYYDMYGIFIRDDDNQFTIGIKYYHTEPTDEEIQSELREYYNYTAYMNQCPGYGADGYSRSENNNRLWFGLGNDYDNRPDYAHSVNCELISSTFPRANISYRDVVPEYESEIPKTIDVVFSAFISTGALAQFREPDKDYIFITEAGLWASDIWTDNGNNGLLAGYRIVPPDSNNWDMTKSENRTKLKQEIIRVGINQVVQVVWKVQLGSIDQLIN